MSGISSLHGTVKHYDWGGRLFIPSLLNINNEEQRPFAEYWMGVHPQAACKITSTNGKEQSLNSFIDTDPGRLLGQYVRDKFGNIPYLLKALDVNDMLSIQVHPSKAAAEQEFAAENAAGVPLDSPQRNYKDNNHKPELMVAIGDFWLLHGFRSKEDTLETLSSIKELNFLLPVFKNFGYKGLYQTVMEMPQEGVNQVLQPLLDRIIPLYNAEKLSKDQPDYWAARGALTFSQPDRVDRGIFSVYLFNLLHLKQGQAIFQDAGIPHAYLYGVNVEIMASSDNVLRGGLTTKHIDVKELLKHTKCEATSYQILEGEKRGDELVYTTPAPDFELSSFKLFKGQSMTYTAATAEMFLLTEGRIKITDTTGSVTLQKGNPSAIVFAGDTIEVQSDEDSLLFKATVPDGGIE
jgi:mannose-6-phosphate isomerase